MNIDNFKNSIQISKIAFTSAKNVYPKYKEVLLKQQFQLNYVRNTNSSLISNKKQQQLG